MIIDLADIQWWQALIGIITGLGLSPAPWILGLATGKIQFTAPADRAYESRVQDLKAGYQLTLQEKDKTHNNATVELTKHHEEIRQYDQERYNEMKLSRDGYRDATTEQRTRADKATDTALRAVEAVEATTHILTSLNEVIGEGGDKP